MINATGVLVAHRPTGTGAAVRGGRGRDRSGGGPRDVEFDLAAGVRLRRGAGASALPGWSRQPRRWRWSTTTPLAMVLAATALTSPDVDDILVSRGELIEIGDRFRLPDLLTSTGARLREVGTTNLQPPSRIYADATWPRTAFILKVHPSDFRIEGFTAAATVPELAGLGDVPGYSTSGPVCSPRTRCCRTSRAPRPRCGTAPPGSRRAATAPRRPAARAAVRPGLRGAA